MVLTGGNPHDATIRSLLRAQIVQYFRVAVAALYLWDFALTLRDEVRWIWGSSWGLGKILFLLGRYTTWAEVILAGCQELQDLSLAEYHLRFVYISVSIIAGIVLAEWILILRTWAIWKRSRRVLCGLLAIFAPVIGVSCYFLHICLSETTTRTLSPRLSGSLITTSPRLVVVPFVLVAAFDTVIMVLTLIKGFEQCRQTSTTLVRSLYRDGILYFVYIFGISLANVIVLSAAPAEFSVLLVEFVRVLHTVFACRILLHLRRAVHDEGAAVSATSVALEFVGPVDMYNSDHESYEVRP